MSRDNGTVLVFSPSPALAISIDSAPAPRDDDELRFSAEGQGVWVTQALTQLGVRTIVCAPFGGQTGGILPRLLGETGADIRATPLRHGNTAAVRDRRGDSVEVLASTTQHALTSHELDEFYDMTLAAAPLASAAVLCGSEPPVVPADTYRRLSSDLQELGVLTITDLHGEPLQRALEGGVSVVKIADDELIEDGLADSDAPDDLIKAMHTLVESGCRQVIVSRAAEPALAMVGGEVIQVHAPRFQAVDPRGSGDSMTASIAAELAAGSSWEDALRLAAAAGAVNVTRHGIATSRRGHIEGIVEHVDIRPFEGVEHGASSADHE